METVTFILFHLMFDLSMAICRLDGDVMDCYNDRKNNVNPIFPSINTTFVSDVVFSNQGNIPWNIRTLSKVTFRNAPLTRRLDVREIGIQYIECDALTNFQEDLKYLHLDNNMLSLFPSCAVRHLSQLEELSLSNNEIHFLSSEMIPRSISVLDLSNNNIGYINQPRSTLAINHDETDSKLEILILNQNRIRSVPPSIVFPYLKYIDIGSNLITHVNMYAFETNTALQFINLDNNRIKQIICDGINSLKQLHTLILSRNAIQDINQNIFLDMLNLKIIDLSNNFLSDINFLDFTTNIHLKYIYLSNNRIQRANMLFDHCNNCSLDLSYNKLETLSLSRTVNIISLNISHNIFTKVPFIPKTVKYFDISYNPLTSATINEFLTTMHSMGPLGLIDRNLGLFCYNITRYIANNMLTSGITLDLNGNCVPTATLCLLKNQEEPGSIGLDIYISEYTLPECKHNARVPLLSVNENIIENATKQFDRSSTFHTLHKFKYSSKSSNNRDSLIVAHDSEPIGAKNSKLANQRTEIHISVLLGIAVAPLGMIAIVVLMVFLIRKANTGPNIYMEIEVR